MSCYYMLLIIPAAMLLFIATAAFRRAGFDEGWRTLAVIVFALTFPGWVLALLTGAHFVLAAAGRAPWSIRGADLTTTPHIAITTLLAGLLTAIALGLLGRSWFLLLTGVCAAAAASVVTLAGLPFIPVAALGWIAALGFSLHAWSRARAAAATRTAPQRPAAPPDPFG